MKAKLEYRVNCVIIDLPLKSDIALRLEDDYTILSRTMGSRVTQGVPAGMCCLLTSSFLCLAALFFLCVLSIDRDNVTNKPDESSSQPAEVTLLACFFPHDLRRSVPSIEFELEKLFEFTIQNKPSQMGQLM